MIDFPFTPFPNDLYEIQKKRSLEERVLLQTIVRFTYGYQRKICKLSLEKFIEETNLSRNTVKKYLRKLEQDKFIIIKINKIKQKTLCTEYQINEEIFINKEKIYGSSGDSFNRSCGDPLSPSKRSDLSIYKKERRKKETFPQGKDNIFAEAQPTQRALTNEEEDARIMELQKRATYTRKAN